MFKPKTIPQNNDFLSKRRKLSTSSENSSSIMDNSSQLSDNLKNCFGDMKIQDSSADLQTAEYINIPQNQNLPDTQNPNKAYQYLQNIISNKKNLTQLDDFSSASQNNHRNLIKNISTPQFNNQKVKDSSRSESLEDPQETINLQQTQQHTSFQNPANMMFGNFQMMVQSMYGLPFNMNPYMQQQNQQNNNNNNNEEKDNQNNNNRKEDDVDVDQTHDVLKPQQQDIEQKKGGFMGNFSQDGYGSFLQQNMSLFSDDQGKGMVFPGGGGGTGTGGGQQSMSSSLSLSGSYGSFVGQQQQEKMIGKLTESERKEKVEKYLEKKKNRKWKNIRYTIRQNLADNRQRSQGRFIKSNNPRFNVNIYDKNVVKSINKQLEKNSKILENLSCPPQMFQQQNNQKL